MKSPIQKHGGIITGGHMTVEVEAGLGTTQGTRNGAHIPKVETITQISDADPEDTKTILIIIITTGRTIITTGEDGEVAKEVAPIIGKDIGTEVTVSYTHLTLPTIYSV